MLVPHAHVPITPIAEHRHRRKRRTDPLRFDDVDQDLEPGGHHRPAPLVRLQCGIVGRAVELLGDLVDDPTRQIPQPVGHGVAVEIPGPQTPTKSS